MAANPTPVHVVAGIIRRGEDILLAKRLPGGPHGGFWEFPGGKVEEGESEEEALRRELKEELDVEVSVGERWREVTHPYPHVTIRLVFFFCTLAEGEPRPVGCEEIQWVPSEKLHHFSMPEADLEIVNAMSGR